MEIINYKDELEREEIIKQKKQEGKILKEDRITLSGNFLIFTDPEETQEQEIKQKYTKTEIKQIIKEYLESKEGKDLIKAIKNV